MKKRILAGLIGTMLISSVAFAAPVSDLKQGETNIGYNFSHLDFKASGEKIDTANTNGFYIEHGINDKFILGLEYNSGDIINTQGAKLEEKETDLYVQYKLDKNVRLVLGNRHYNLNVSDSSSSVSLVSDDKLLYGLSLDTALADKINGYTTLLKTSDETEWKIGATYEIDKQTNFDINYKSKDFDNKTDLKGFGFGLNYKF